MVTMPGGLAEFERDLDPRPHGEGRAPARGERQHHQKETLARRESGGATDGDRSQLQRQRGDDFEASLMTSQPQTKERAPAKPRHEIKL